MIVQFRLILHHPVMKAILLFFLFTQSILLFGQTKTITGRVIDEDGNPVAFASILEKNTHNGTSADKDGFYKLDKVIRDSLVCSHINYETKTESISINNKIIFILSRHIFQHMDATFIKEIYVRKEWHHPDTATIKDTTKKDQRFEEDADKIFSRVEIPAVLMNGRYDLRQYFNKNLKMDSATTFDFEGKVIVRFTVDKTGKAKNVVIIRGINRFTDAAVIDVIDKMPLWEPAMQNGRDVDSEQQIAVYFNVTSRYPLE
jgi:hypothetical protein